jgi:hypothetical protein
MPRYLAASAAMSAPPMFRGCESVILLEGGVTFAMQRYCRTATINAVSNWRAPQTN